MYKRILGGLVAVGILALTSAALYFLSSLPPRESDAPRLGICSSPDAVLEISSSLFYTGNVQPSVYENTLQFSPSGQFLALILASEIRVWNLASTEIFTTPTDPFDTFGIISVEDGKLLYSNSTGFYTWDFAQQAATPDFIPLPKRSLAVSNRVGDKLLINTSAGVNLWDMSSQTALQSLNIPAPLPQKLSLLRLSPTQKYAVFATSESDSGDSRNKSRLMAWDIERNRELYVWDRPATSAMNIRFNATGTHLISGHGDGDVWVWDMATGQALSRFDHYHCGGMRGAELALNADETLLAVGHTDGRISLWDWQAARLLGVLTSAQAAGITGLDFHPTENVLAVVDEDGRLVMWDIEIKP